MKKTSTEYSRERRARMRAKGYKLVGNLWTKPEHEPAIRAHADKLNKGEK